MWKAKNSRVHEPLRPRFDGYYRSSLLRSEDWHAGVKMVRECHRYLKLFKNGLWLAKNNPTPDLDFPTYLASVPQETFRAGLAGEHPFDDAYDFVHQTGRLSQVGDRLKLIFWHRSVIMQELRWEFRVMFSARLVEDSGAVYLFHPKRRSRTKTRRG